MNLALPYPILKLLMHIKELMMLTTNELIYSKLIDKLGNLEDFNCDEIAHDLNTIEVLNRVTSEGDTLLHLVMDRYSKCHKGNKYYSPDFLQSVEDQTLTLLELLISKGIHINAINKRGETFLHKAVKAGSNKIIKKLARILENDDFLVDDTNDNTLLHHVSRGYRYYYSKYYEYSQDSHISKKEFEQIVEFVEMKYLKTISMLIKSGIDVDKKNRYGETALHLAVRDSRSIPMVKLFFKAKANYKLTDNELNSVLHLATSSQKNTFEITKYLLENRCRKLVNCTNDNGQTPIHTLLAKEEFPERDKTLAYLLNSTEINLDAINHELQTPLHLAVIKADYNSVKLLRNHKYQYCRLNPQDIKGNTPMDLAVNKHQEYKKMAVSESNKLEIFEKIIHLLVKEGALTNVNNYDFKSWLTTDTLINDSIRDNADQITREKVKQNVRESLNIIIKNTHQLEYLTKTLTGKDLGFDKLNKNLSICLKYRYVFDGIINTLKRPLITEKSEEIDIDLEYVTNEKNEVAKNKIRIRKSILGLFNNIDQMTMEAWQSEFWRLHECYELFNRQEKFYEVLIFFIVNGKHMVGNSDWTPLGQPLSILIQNDLLTTTLLKEIDSQIKHKLQEEDDIKKQIEAYIKTISEIGGLLCTTNPTTLKKIVNNDFIVRLKVNIDFALMKIYTSSTPQIVLRDREKRENDLRELRIILSKFEGAPITEGSSSSRLAAVTPLPTQGFFSNTRANDNLNTLADDPSNSTRQSNCPN
jgi:ankyrin repeat protein